MPASIFGNPAAVVQLNQALFGNAPGNAKYANQLAQANATSAVSFARQLGQTVATGNDALAASVLANLGINNATLQTALGQAFAAFPNDRGVVVLNLTNILTTLEGNSVYGAAAAQFNAQVATNFQYSSNPVNTADSAVNAGTVTLTANTDVLTGNVFTSGLVFTPGGDDRINSLQDEDVLTGTGANARLDATLGNINDNGGRSITPTLNGISIVNVAFTGNNGANGNGANRLDLQDATGLTNAVNITRVSDTTNTVQVDNLTAPVTNLSVANSNSNTAVIGINFAAGALSGTTDTTTLTLNRVNVVGLSVEDTDGNGLTNAVTGVVGLTDGYETINLVSSGAANTVGTFSAEDLRTLNISGAQNLTLGSTNNTVSAGLVEATRFNAGLTNVSGSLSAVNAAAFAGRLTYHIGAEINAIADDTSGVPVQLQVTGGTADDTFVLTQGASIDAAAGNIDRIDGGTGANKLVLTGGAAQAVNAAGTPAAPVANVLNVQALEVRTGHDDNTDADAVTVNADAFNALATVFVRNEGQNGAAGANGTSQAEGSTVTLNNLTSAQANGITVAHGTTGNSTIANNIIAANLKVATGTADTATLNIVDGVNTDPVFNVNLSTVGVERVTFNDRDTESNTVHLNQGTSVTTAPAAGQYAQAGSSITITGGQATKYFSLDSFGAAAVAGAGTDGYGYATTGVATSSTTVAQTAAVPVGLPAGTTTGTRDTAVALVLTGAGNNIAEATATRVLVESIDASTYVGDVVVRLGDITRADGFSSQNIRTFTGNDTFIFDALGLTSAGFTSGDTIAAGAGTDTLVIDGNTATLPGTPRISIQASEWDNLTGIDVLRFAANQGVANVGNGAQVANAGGSYYARIDNEFVTQTDATNRLTVVNNDGRLDLNSETDLVLDLRGLTQSKWITFVGANGIGAAGISSNRIVVDDVSANPNMILDGGDTDIRVATTGGYVAGNNNAFEVRNTADVSINDLAQTRNFGLINFSNDQAVAQTLTLTLNNNNVEALVDASKLATNAATAEVLFVTATDNGAVASQLNIDARQVTAFHALNVTGSNVGNDVLNLNSNVGGSGHVANLQGGASDRVNWFGGSATTTVNANLATGAMAFTDGTVTTTHTITNAEFLDISGLTYATSTLTGTALANTIVGGAGVDVITGAGGADQLTGNGGNDTFALTDGATIDTITDFSNVAGNTDVISFSVAGLNGTIATGLLSNGASAAVAAGAAVVQHITAATAVNAATNVFAIDGTFANAAALETAIEAGGTRQITLTAAGAVDDDYLVVWSDGTNSHVGYYNQGTAATTFAAAGTYTEIATLTGVNTAAQALLASGNFLFVA